MDMKDVMDLLQYDTEYSMFGVEFKCIKKAYEFIENWLGYVDNATFFEAIKISEARCMEIAEGSNEYDTPTFMEYSELILDYIAYGSDVVKDIPYCELIPTMEFLCDEGGFDLPYYLREYKEDIELKQVLYWIRDDYYKKEVIRDFEMRG